MQLARGEMHLARSCAICQSAIMSDHWPASRKFWLELAGCHRCCEMHMGTHQWNFTWHGHSLVGNLRLAHIGTFAESAMICKRKNVLWWIVCIGKTKWPHMTVGYSHNGCQAQQVSHHRFQNEATIKILHLESHISLIHLLNRVSTISQRQKPMNTRVCSVSSCSSTMFEHQPVYTHRCVSYIYNIYIYI